METLPAFDLVLFGGTGDLATRKLVPALYRRDLAGLLTPESRIIGCGRSPLERDDYIATLKDALHRRLQEDEWDETVWKRFADRLDYSAIDVTAPDDYHALARHLRDDGSVLRVFFLSISPDYFVDICQQLDAASLVSPGSRLVLEKPIGDDRQSAMQISDAVAEIFPEERTYRIDHYLGKETVQNLLALRFANTLFEPLWNSRWVRDIQISAAEHIGVEGRAAFYDRTGALRDMVQSHLLQLLCIIAMEPPVSMDANSVHTEKLKVLRALRPLVGTDAIQSTVRGQYRAGAIGGVSVSAYREEEEVAPDSLTETFVALRAEIGNWRWSGVPFYLRTGKRMARKDAEIVINFRDVPHSIFDTQLYDSQPNRLILRLQPERGLQLSLWMKPPGDRMALRRVPLDLDFAETEGGTRALDAYERLLSDMMRDRKTLFMSRDELEAAWAWIDPIRRAWDDIGDAPRQYMAGTWGPAASSTLLAREGTAWHEEM